MKGMFSRPTSVFVAGSSRPLLNWVVYAITSAADPEFVWTDVRLGGEVLDPDDLLAQGVIPPRQLGIVAPEDLRRNIPPEGLPVKELLREEDRTGMAKRLTDFLRLPLHTQELLSEIPPGDRPAIRVLSNAHRLAAYYPTETVGQIVGAIVSAGATFVATWADAPPSGRLAFDTVLHVDGHSVREWRNAVLRVEVGDVEVGLGPGMQKRLAEISQIASVLSAKLGDRESKS
jgi:hypothetical protein